MIMLYVYTFMTCNNFSIWGFIGKISTPEISVADNKLSDSHFLPIMLNFPLGPKYVHFFPDKKTASKWRCVIFFHVKDYIYMTLDNTRVNVEYPLYFCQCFFFSRDNLRFARDVFRKSTRDFGKVPVTKNSEFCPWKLTSCPWQNCKKSAREKWKVPVTISEILPVT